MSYIKRTPGVKPKKFTPQDIYSRNRRRYHYKVSNGLITTEEFNRLMDKNLEEFNRDKKNSSLSDF